MKIVKSKKMKGDCMRCGMSKKEAKDRGGCAYHYKNHKWK